jgi:glyoxylase-like metal-dependent hydrolase (beta-lactamase superfamily II)
MHKTFDLEPIVHHVYELVTGTWQYVIADPATQVAVIIDSVLDYDKENGIVDSSSADKLLAVIDDNKYQVNYILETHAHADHLSASRYLQSVLSHRQSDAPKVCIGQRILQVQQTFGTIYCIPQAELENAFDRLLQDDEQLNLGNLIIRVIHLPGHTPDHVGYIVGSNVFTGDTIFNPDVGSARCDFPGGSTSELFRSTRRLLDLPAHYKLYTGHDYPPSKRDCHSALDASKAIPFSTVEKQRQENKHLKSGTSEVEFVNWRNERDEGLQLPRLFHPSIRTNIRGGRLPRFSEDEFKIVKVPEGIIRVT